MERATTHYRPRVSRETRLLVTTALLAVLALWMLARLRFPAPPAQPRAVSQLLTSLGAGADFDGLASQVARVQGLVGGSLIALDFDVMSEDGMFAVSRAALRVGGDIAVVQVPEHGQLKSSAAAVLLAHDVASGLAVLRVPADQAASGGTPRIAPPPEPPQYVIATAIYPNGVALQPVFLAATAEVDAPLWSATASALPLETGLTPGTWLFTRDGEFAGLTVAHERALAIVSSGTVLDEANRLIARPSAPAGDYGIQVERLTSALGRALDARSGVVVTWVDPRGPARGLLAAGDVIEGVAGQPLPTLEHWQRHRAALAAGIAVDLSVRRAGDVVAVTVTPVSGAAAGSGVAGSGPALALGATTRTLRGSGTEVVAVESGSRAAAAGLRTGDIVTSAGVVQAPASATLDRLVRSLSPGQTLLLGVRRGEERRLLVLER